MCVIQTGTLSSSFSRLIASNEALLAEQAGAADLARDIGSGRSSLSGAGQAAERARSHAIGEVVGGQANYERTRGRINSGT
jgi:hypothetical protein